MEEEKVNELQSDNNDRDTCGGKTRPVVSEVGEGDWQCRYGEWVWIESIGG